MLEAKFGDDPLPPFQLPLLIVILFLILWIALSLVSTRRLKTIKGAKIESCKGDGVNRLVCMLGNKLFSHLIAFKRQKKAIADIKKKIAIGNNRSKSSDLLHEQLRIFPVEIGKKMCHEKILAHVHYMFV